MLFQAGSVTYAWTSQRTRNGIYLSKRSLTQLDLSPIYKLYPTVLAENLVSDRFGPVIRKRIGESYHRGTNTLRTS